MDDVTDARPRPVYDPVVGRPLDEVPWTSVAMVPEIVSRAVTAGHAWQVRSTSERVAVLLAVADVVEAAADELAALETANTGKPLVDTLREAHRAAGSFRYYAGWVHRQHGVVADVGAEAFLTTTRVPRGVVLGIVPWNVPLFFCAKKFAPALAFGNACIVKPAPETPLTALRLVGLMREAGVPDDAAQVVVGGGDIGQALIEEPRVDAVVFTGSDRTGRLVAAAAGRRGLATVMELGGKSAQLVFADADIEPAVEGLLLGAYGATGQMCIAGSRIYADRRVADELVTRLTDRVRQLKVGDPRCPGVHVGPQVTAAQQRKSLDMLGRAQAAGAQVLAEATLPCDPRLAEGFFVPPTLLGNVAADAEIARHEVFGPVATIATFDDEDDAVRCADATEFGLAAGIWTSDLGRAHRVAARLHAGTVWINTYRVLSDLVPFGGNGWSGYGRENGQAAMDVYTAQQATWFPTGCTVGAEVGLPARSF